MSNRKLGTDFEREFAQILADNGFWVHRMAQNASGQPFDIIAAKDGKTYPIDCKVCTKDRFLLERCEENQRLSMKLWREKGNGIAWFALKLSNGQILMVSHQSIELLMEKGVKSPNYEKLRAWGFELGVWLGMYA